MRIIMSNEEKKERMARNYAINSKKTPRTRRMHLPEHMPVVLSSLTPS